MTTTVTICSRKSSPLLWADSRQLQEEAPDRVFIREQAVRSCGVMHMHVHAVIAFSRNSGAMAGNK